MGIPHAVGNPAIDNLLRFFEYDHLPEELQKISAPFRDVAVKMAKELPQSPELTAGLRKLLEAKDCFVRARL